ncbi:MAG: family 16 glycosylhydrolase [Bacteroidales bacterium]
MKQTSFPKAIIVLFLLCMPLFQAKGELKKDFHPGLEWLDTNGKPINAHGGGVIFHKGVYYWYGEHKIEGKSEKDFADGGIHCYSSTDLINWTDRGIVLSVDYKDENSDITYGCILERPKVVYNEKSKKFIAYFKLYLKGVGYVTSNVGVAVADKPYGPFTYSHKFLGGGSLNGSGDFCMFKDIDGSVYHLTVRKPDKSFVIGKLQPDYLSTMPNSYQVAKGITRHTEAPAVIYRKGKYYLLGSGSTGFNPNAARLFVADSLQGEFTNLGNPTFGVNPHNGIGPEKTFGGQISCIIPVQGKKDAYIAVFDVWRQENPITGGYIWLPVTFKNNQPEIHWMDKWNLSFFDKKVKKTKLNSFVDPQSSPDEKPFVVNDSSKTKWKLDFSDEFNGRKIDTTKWNVETSIKKRIDVTLFADSNQVEEKDGNIFIYYRKSAINDTAYNAGRFNSKGKYAPTYGFLECRMHVVKPNGHQTAFWMMPEGDGMRGLTTPDGTANDGAEIDIVEGSKANAYSNGLHWDGYAKPAHKSNGKLMKMPNMHDAEYHIYGFEWTSTYLKFYFDGKVVREMNDPKLIPHVAHFLYFSGSCFGKNDWLDGDIRKNEFIQSGHTDKAYIDYVRVFQKFND